MEKISQICPFAENLFQPPSNSITMSPKQATFHVLFGSPGPTARTIYPVSWLEALDTISSKSAPKILTCGQKGVGKSTFCQFLVNSFIRHKPVTYLETDPGQPSFSPPGLASIHSLTTPILSPPFARSGISSVQRCHHIGNISPRDNPRHFIDCITDLLSHDSRDAPTIINTPGWTKGTGYELLTSLIDIARPDFIIVLSTPGKDSLARSLHPLASNCQSHVLVVESTNTISPAVPLTAADLRTLWIISYFHRTGRDRWDFATHLTAWKPWMVKFSGEDRGIWAVAIQGEELLLEDILLAINGTMVAITISSATTVEEVSTTAEGIPILMNREVKFVDPNSSRCVGYAVIRGIDVIKRWMFLLSPWEPSSVKEDEKIILERGHVNLPVWGLWAHSNSPKKLGPWLQH
jgi:polynucleotide 5'-hydroxyl-kinase GRC3/NOL9